MLLDKPFIYLIISAEFLSESHQNLDLQPTTNHMEPPVIKNDYSPLLQVTTVKLKQIK